MFGRTNSVAAKNGDNLQFGDPTVPIATVGQANYMIIVDFHEESNEVGVGEVGLMILAEPELT